MSPLKDSPRLAKREIQMWEGLLLPALKIQTATLWRGSCGKEIQAASGSRTSQSYNPKEVNAATWVITLLTMVTALHKSKLERLMLVYVSQAAGPHEEVDYGHSLRC